MSTRKFAAPLMALVLLSGVSTHSIAAYAADTSQNAPKATPATSSGAAKAPSATDDASKTAAKGHDQKAGTPALTVSDAGYEAMRNVRAARLAIFNGDTDQAKTFIGQAKDRIGSAQSEAVAIDLAAMQPAPGDGTGSSGKSSENGSSDPSAAAGTSAGGSGKAADASGNAGARSTDQASADGPMKYVLIDEGVALSEDFVMTPENKEHVDKANEHLKSGDQQAARDELDLAEIDVTSVFTLIPATASVNGINQASDLIDQGKYYEAGMALKSVEDAMVVEAVETIGLPDDTAVKGSTTDTNGGGSANGGQAAEPATN